MLTDKKLKAFVPTVMPEIAKLFTVMFYGWNCCPKTNMRWNLRPTELCCAWPLCRGSNLIRLPPWAGICTTLLRRSPARGICVRLFLMVNSAGILISSDLWRIQAFDKID